MKALGQDMMLCLDPNEYRTLLKWDTSTTYNRRSWSGSIEQFLDFLDVGHANLSNRSVYARFQIILRAESRARISWREFDLPGEHCHMAGGC